MAQRCPEGKYLDRLVRECVSCSTVCHAPAIHTRCSEFCVASGCTAVPGHFYDRLLKKCLRCSELCGSHPSQCSKECKSTAPAVTQKPTGDSAVQLIVTRGRAAPGAELYTEALLYSLLGLFIAVFICILTAVILVLLRRAKGQQQHDDTKTQQPMKQGQSSKDSLMARAEDVSQEVSVNMMDRPKATETCVYCFSDHTRAPHVLHQQAGPQRVANAEEPEAYRDNHHHANGPLNHPVNANGYDKTRPFRIICSPTQTSI